MTALYGDEMVEYIGGPWDGAVEPIAYFKTRDPKSLIFLDGVYTVDWSERELHWHQDPAA
jgi:hypothetical protein